MVEGNGIFHLNSGRTMFMHEFEQRPTYLGLMEGLPTREMNNSMLKAAESWPEEKWRCNCVVIEPTRTPITGFGDDPFGTPEKMPSIRCAAVFQSNESSVDAPSDYSMLAVVWWQDDFAFPIVDHVLSQLLNLDWESHASFFDY